VGRGGRAGANARSELPKRAADYFAEVRKTLAENPTLAELHRVRLATKRLRYTLELFRPCYGPGLETRLAALRAIQQLLGEVNDSVSAAKLLPKSMRARNMWSGAVKRRPRSSEALERGVRCGGTGAALGGVSEEEGAQAVTRAKRSADPLAYPERRRRRNGSAAYVRSKSIRPPRH